MGRQAHPGFLPGVTGTIVFVQNRDFFGARIVHIPLLHALKRLYPACPLRVFAPFSQAAFFADIGLADEVVVYPGASGQLLRQLRTRSPERVVSLRPQSQGINLLIRLSGARERIGFQHVLTRSCYTHQVRRDVSIYRVQNYLNLLPHLPEGFRWGDHLNALARQSTLAVPPTPYLCLLPGGGAGEFKRWPLHRFIEISRELAPRWPHSAWVLGPDEQSYAPTIREQVGPTALLLQNAHLSDMARVIGGAGLTVANDCGPSHIAQVMERPYVGLFSDFDGKVGNRIREWFHPHPSSRVVRSRTGQGIKAITVTDVLAAAHEASPPVSGYPAASSPAV